MTDWKYTDNSKKIVSRTLDDGSVESCMSCRCDVVEWVNDGNTIREPDVCESDVVLCNNSGVAKESTYKETLESLKSTVDSMADGTQKSALLAIITILEA